LTPLRGRFAAGGGRFPTLLYRHAGTPSRLHLQKPLDGKALPPYASSMSYLWSLSGRTLFLIGLAVVLALLCTACSYALHTTGRVSLAVIPTTPAAAPEPPAAIPSEVQP